MFVLFVYVIIIAGTKRNYYLQKRRSDKKLIKRSNLINFLSLRLF